MPFGCGSDIYKLSVFSFIMGHQRLNSRIPESPTRFELNHFVETGFFSHFPRDIHSDSGFINGLFKRFMSMRDIEAVSNSDGVYLRNKGTEAIYQWESDATVGLLCAWDDISARKLVGHAVNIGSARELPVVLMSHKNRFGSHDLKKDNHYSPLRDQLEIQYAIGVADKIGELYLFNGLSRDFTKARLGSFHRILNSLR